MAVGGQNGLTADRIWVYILHSHFSGENIPAVKRTVASGRIHIFSSLNPTVAAESLAHTLCDISVDSPAAGSYWLLASALITHSLLDHHDSCVGGPVYRTVVTFCAAISFMNKMMDTTSTSSGLIRYEDNNLDL